MFASRNALFRHIRAAPDCALASGETQPPKRQRVALLFGYNNDSHASGGKLLAAFQASLKHALTGYRVEFVGSTQSSVANARPSALGLETSCAAAEDVMVVTFLAPDEVYQEKLGNVVTSTQEALDGISSGVALHCCRPLARDKPLHAEHSCTQHIFHYLLPMKWLPDHESLLAWYNHNGDGRPPAPPALRRFKEILRTTESRTVKRQVIAHRFGALAHKERRPWHNYADPELYGKASPSHDTVWRVLDRARFHGYVETSKDDVYIVYEFCGDEFLKQQVRRLVGTAVAMIHEWLPPDFIELSTNRRVIVETPLAPEGLIYRAGSRFHREEISFQGKQLFDSDEAFTLNGEPREWIQTELVASSDQKEEVAWLADLRDLVTTRIRTQLQVESACESEDSLASERQFSAAPSEYTRVIALLQEIAEGGRWPTTSVARSTVIGNMSNKEQEQGGSFTVLNMRTNQVTEENLPQGNSLFPLLAEAIFDLESVLADRNSMNHLDGSEMQRRPASSHCAVNCNAQFTPHVDTGKGAGQSLSMIVGLGNYSGGELMVEGDAHDIRYRALEFDGWKMRHWTRPFVGQRFSLVWFTPE